MRPFKSLEGLFGEFLATHVVRRPGRARRNRSAVRLITRQGLVTFGCLLLLGVSPSLTSSDTATPNEDFTEVLWIGQKDRLSKVDVDSGETLVEISPLAVDALTIDETRGVVWAYGGGVLAAYEFDGTLQQSIDVGLLSGQNNDHDDHGSDDGDSDDHDSADGNSDDHNSDDGDSEDHGSDDHDSDDGDSDDHGSDDHDSDDHGSDDHDSDDHHDDHARASLAVDNESGIVWLGVERDLYAISASGSLIGTQTLDRPIVDLAFDGSNQHVWAATKKDVIAFELSLVEDFRLDLSNSEKIAALARNPTDSSILIAGKNDIRRYLPDGAFLSSLAIDKADRLAAIPQGELWVARKKHLKLVDIETGSVRFSIKPFGNSGKIEALAVEQGDGSVWPASKKQTRRVDRQGQPGPEINVPKKIRSLVHYQDLVAPAVTIVAPAADALVNTNRPEIEIEFADAGIGVDPATLALILDGDPLAADCSTSDTGAVCQPGGAPALCHVPEERVRDQRTPGLSGA